MQTCPIKKELINYLSTVSRDQLNASSFNPVDIPQSPSARAYNTLNTNRNNLQYIVSLKIYILYSIHVLSGE